jgi:hypothetical protein
MKLVTPVARPPFTWNSKGVMLQAGEGLAHHLEAPLVDAGFTARPGHGPSCCMGPDDPRLSHSSHRGERAGLHLMNLTDAVVWSLP